jgi:alpha-amylase
LTDIVFVFEVHQPYRLRQDFFWEDRPFRRVSKADLFEHYFDVKVNREIFNRTCAKCYFPSNQILLNAIDRHGKTSNKVKVSFSLSGVFLEQCEQFNKDLLESFRQLAETGCVEFLCQTYYHSLASFYPESEEFAEQVKKHRQTVKNLLGYEPLIFENTELLYNNVIAKAAEEMGFKGIFAEGAERILQEKSPNYLYKPENCGNLKVLLRNYKLTDDIGFRFSARVWGEWPLTAPKYASWLAGTPGDYIAVFPDYETFGEHHWPESGIQDFLSFLPDEVLKHPHMRMATPSEVVDRYSAAGEIDVPELGGTVSWADVKRDTSGWLGNTMQWAYYLSVRRLEPLAKETEDEELLRIWRLFQTSDHLYYMFTESGGPGEVHSYFSPFRSAVDAYVTAQSALLDFESRIKQMAVAANEPFHFHTAKGEKYFTGLKAWGLKGFAKSLRIASVESLQFHSSNGDFERWADWSLGDGKLANQLRKIRLSKIKGKELRRALVEAAEERLKELCGTA